MFVSTDPAMTANFARALAMELRGGETLALVGPLGAGKTQFVKGLADGLGLAAGNVTSPTFTILHEYRRLGDGQPLTLNHADFYRLETAAEAAALGLEELFDDPGAVTVIEWADKFPALLPTDARWYYFRIPKDDETRREIALGSAPATVAAI